MSININTKQTLSSASELKVALLYEQLLNTHDNYHICDFITIESAIKTFDNYIILVFDNHFNLLGHEIKLTTLTQPYTISFINGTYQECSKSLDIIRQLIQSRDLPSGLILDNDLQINDSILDNVDIPLTSSLVFDNIIRV